MRNARGNGLMLLCLLAVAGGAQERALSQDAAAALGGTSWRLVRFQGSDDTTLTPGEKAGYTIAFEAEGRVSMRVDCNRGSGTWKSAGPNQLEFGPLAVTSAMCSPAPLNNRLPRDFQYVRSYILKDGHLLLSLMADGGVYEFEPIQAEGETAGIVKGTATYRERMALPPGAILEATLEDVSKADAAAEQIAQTRVEHPGNPPIPFEIKYDPARIAPNHRYAVRARILVGEQLLFTTDQQYPVLTGGHGHEVQLLLRRASATPPAGGQLALLSRWRARTGS